MSRISATRVRTSLLLATWMVLSISGWAEDRVPLPLDTGTWSPASPHRADSPPTGSLRVDIRGVGTFDVAVADVATLRTDIFVPGWFSPLDVLVALDAAERIDLVYGLDAVAGTHRIVSLNGLEGWWYDVKLPGGAFERTAVRMDLYPVKGGSTLSFYLEAPDRLEAIWTSFREEAARRAATDQIVIPTVTIRGPRATLTYHDVRVTPHGSRSDVFLPDVVTALDVLLSLGEQGGIPAVHLAWHATVDGIEGVNHYMVEWIEGADLGIADPSCGFAHMAATDVLWPYLTPHSHASTRIHLSPDVEVLVSPAVVEWTWLCAIP